ncbi:hypothetical protein OPQ81_003003 [Rhizoctonia solani]|nr:hypothetical protein OPQ81_003003 [Rhizoctonia solani]
MMIEASPSKGPSKASRCSFAAFPDIPFTNPYRPNDKVFGNLASLEGQYERSQTCWILGTVIAIHANHVLVNFSEDHTRWLSVCDVVLARHFRALEEEPKGAHLGASEIEIYVSDLSVACRLALIHLVVCWVVLYYNIP